NLNSSEQDIRIKEYHDSIVTSPLEQMGAYNLVKSRVDMLQAKQLVATTANHMSDISMSQISNTMLELDFGLGVRDFNRMFVLGEDGNNDMKITKMVSFLMNAAVDAAKDNFII